jgi:hypothetical protein
MLTDREAAEIDTHPWFSPVSWLDLLIPFSRGCIVCKQERRVKPTLVAAWIGKQGGIHLVVAGGLPVK